MKEKANTYKPKPTPAPERKPKSSSKVGAKVAGAIGGALGKVFSLGVVREKLKMDKVFGDGVPVEYFPYALYISLITIIYVANSHYADKTVRQIAKTKAEVEDLRADYTTLKADYMFAGKQSEVAKSVLSEGLEESSSPPYKIELKPTDYLPEESE